jgi:cyclopropane-fatty-acyl-phospholipid synthase
MNLQVLNKFIRVGEVTVIDHQGRTHVFGAGLPKSSIRLNRANALSYILRNPALNIGESYIQGMWDVPEGHTLHELMTLLRLNFDARLKPRKSLRWLQILPIMLSTWNSLKASRQNIAHHYDLDEDLFRVCLDQEMHYSCAYFAQPDMTLEDAQQAKSSHIATKLNLEPGQRVLDIGCGWGSLAMYLATHYDVQVTDLTLSVEQLRVAEQTAKERGLEHKVRFVLQDYRHHQETYDRVVSVGMLEHVGRKNLPKFFACVRDFLTPSGVALVHTIGNGYKPGMVNPWIRRHVFPGGYIPGLADVAKAIEAADLPATDVEVLREHYALTLAHWLKRFADRRDAFVSAKGEAFCRMWEFYLILCQTGFEVGGLVVHQWQLAKNNQALPLTRAYLYGQANSAQVDPKVISC